MNHPNRHASKDTLSDLKYIKFIANHCKMLQIACWFYFSDIKPSISINQKLQIYHPLNSHIGLYIPTISMKNNSILGQQK